MVTATPISIKPPISDVRAMWRAVLFSQTGPPKNELVIRESNTHKFGSTGSSLRKNDDDDNIIIIIIIIIWENETNGVTAYATVVCAPHVFFFLIHIFFLFCWSLSLSVVLLLFSSQQGFLFIYFFVAVVAAASIRSLFFSVKIHRIVTVCLSLPLPSYYCLHRHHCWRCCRPAEWDL